MILLLCTLPLCALLFHVVLQNPGKEAIKEAIFAEAMRPETIPILCGYPAVFLLMKMPTLRISLIF